MPLRTSSARLSMKFLAINTLMPCINFSVERDPVLDVAIEPVRLLDQDHPTGHRATFEVAHHLAESGPPALLGRLDIDELLYHRQAVFTPVLPEQPQLGGDRESVALLLFTGDPGVDDRPFAINR